jgi:hypothetical protein
MKLKVSFVLFMVFSFVMVSYIPHSNSNTIFQTDEYYFEDVYVIITGRCGSIGSVDEEWTGGLFIGNQTHPTINAYDLPLERLNINIYKEFKSDPFFSLIQSKDIGVDIIHTNGIFFWGCWKQYSARLIPPVIFVICYTEEIYIHLM